ncbi:Lyase [Bradyrhizobium sp. Gha]|nr:Lyase [Bradyrhizobium sp. Gha]
MRTEHDLLGAREVPLEAYYGVHTVRAVENFPISGIAISAYPELIGALAAIKQAAALSNMELGLLDQRRGRAIVAACEELRAGRLHDQFVVDVIQGGAGTSTNKSGCAKRGCCFDEINLPAVRAGSSIMPDKRERGLLTEAALAAILKPEMLTRPQSPAAADRDGRQIQPS